MFILVIIDNPGSGRLPTFDMKGKTGHGVGPSICVTAIVKNEETRIIRMLEAAREVCSCWCVLDTGSTDNTLQVLANYNAENQATFPGHVFEGPFIDFSQARNLLLDHAQSLADWILMADADYEWENLHLLPNELTADVDCLYMRGSGDIQYWSVKCVRTGLPWKYVNRVHENLAPLNRERTSYSQARFIDEWGERMSPEKYEWYASLQLQDVEEFPDTPLHAHRLGDTYAILNDFKKAAKYYRKALRLYESDSQLFYDALWRLGTCMNSLGYGKEAQTIWLRAARLRLPRREALSLLLAELNKEENYTQTSKLGREFNQYASINQLETQSGQPVDTWMVDTHAWLATRLEWARAEAMLGNISECREIYAGLQEETIPDEHQTKYGQLTGFIQATKHL